MLYYLPGIAMALVGLIIFVICKHYCIDGINAVKTRTDSDEWEEHSIDLSSNGQASIKQLDLPSSFSDSDQFPPSYTDCNVEIF